MDTIGKKLGRYMWDKAWEKPVGKLETQAMIEKCLDILDNSSDIPEKEYLSHRCIEKVLNYTTDESLKKAAGLAERLASSMHKEEQHASNVSILRAIAGSFSGNLPLAALAISAMDSSILPSSKEEIGRIYLSELAQSAAATQEKSLIASALAFSKNNGAPLIQCAGYRAALSMLTSPLTMAADQALLQTAKNLAKSSKDSSDIYASSHFLSEFGKTTSNTASQVLAETAASLMGRTSEVGSQVILNSTLSVISGNTGEPLEKQLMEAAKSAFESAKNLQDKGEIAAACIQSMEKISSDPLMKKLGTVLSDLQATGNDTIKSMGSTVAFNILLHPSKDTMEKTFFTAADEILMKGQKLAEIALEVKPFLDAAVREMDDPAKKGIITKALDLPDSFNEDSHRVMLYAAIMDTLQQNEEKGNGITTSDILRNNLRGWDSLKNMDESERLNGKLRTAQIFSEKMYCDEFSKVPQDPCRKSIIKALIGILSPSGTIPVNGKDVVFSKEFQKASVIACEAVLEELSKDIKGKPEEAPGRISRNILDRVGASCPSGVEAAYTVRPFIEEIEKITSDDTVRSLAQIGREIHEKGVFVYKSEEIVYRAMLDIMETPQNSKKDILLAELAIKCGKEWDTLKSSADRTEYPYNVEDSSDTVRSDTTVGRGKFDIAKAFTTILAEVTTDPARKAVVRNLQKMLSQDYLIMGSMSIRAKVNDGSSSFTWAANSVFPFLTIDYTVKQEELLAKAARSIIEKGGIASDGKRRSSMVSPFLNEIHHVTKNDTVRNLTEVALRIGELNMEVPTYIKTSNLVALNAIDKHTAGNPDRALVQAAKEAIQMTAADKDHYEYNKGTDKSLYIHSYLTQLRNTTENPVILKILANLGSLEKIDNKRTAELEMTFELLNKLFEAENLAESAADPSNAGEITTDEGHIDIGGVKLEIRPEKKMGFLTAGFYGLTAQMA